MGECLPGIQRILGSIPLTIKPTGHPRKATSPGSQTKTAGSEPSFSRKNRPRGGSALPNITTVRRELGLQACLQDFPRQEPCVCPPCYRGGSETHRYKRAHGWLILVTAEPMGSQARPYKGKRDRKVGKLGGQPWPQIQPGSWMTLQTLQQEPLEPLCDPCLRCRENWVKGCKHLGQWLALSRPCRFSQVCNH